MSANTDIVEAFCKDWAGRDIEKLMAYFAEDAEYYNSPIGAVKGKAAIQALLSELGGPATSVSCEILGMAESRGGVFTERVDRFDFNGKVVELPVAGVFEIRDGRISSWRDYFDMATWTRQVGG